MSEVGNSVKKEESSTRPVPFNYNLFPNSIDEGMQGTLSIINFNLGRNIQDHVTYNCIAQVSPSLLFGNIKWQLCFEAQIGQRDLQFIIKVDEKNKSPNWFIHSSVKLVATDSEGKLFELRAWTPLEFKNSNSSYHLSANSSELGPLFPDEDVSMTCLIELHVVVTRSFGFRRRQAITLDLTKQTPESDLILHFDTGLLYVNSGYLAQLSEFFAMKKKYEENACISNSADDKDKKTSAKSRKCDRVNGLRQISMSGEMQQFLDLLLVVYPSKKPIDALNVEYILSQADEFSFLGVLVDCENFLMSAAGDKMDVFMRLEWGCRYHMADLQDHCLSKLTSCAAITKVKDSPAYETLPYDVMKSLFERLMTMSDQLQAAHDQQRRDMGYR